MKKLLILICISFFLISCASNKASYSSNNTLNKNNGVINASADEKPAKAKKNCKRSRAKTGSNLAKITCKKT